MLEQAIYFLLSHAGKIITLLLAFVTLRCLLSKNLNLILTSIALVGLAVPAWLQAWDNPDQMAITHFFVLLFVTFAYKSHLSRKLIISVLVMMAADLACVWYYGGRVDLSNSELLLWRSALNVIFICQCLFTIAGSSQKAITRAKEQGNESRFFARGIHSQ